MNKSHLYEQAKKYENRGRLDKAYQYYLEAVLSEEDGDAMYELGYMYYEGDYVHEDYDKAGYYFGLAYDHGAEVLEFTLIIAGSYWEQKAQNDDAALLQAIKYYQAAADMGVGYGNECLGKIYYELGEYDKAYENLLKMEGRNPCGFYYMAKLYDEGLGVEQNLDIAIDYYKKAVKAGTNHEEEYGEDRDAAQAKLRLSELKVAIE